MRYTSKIMDMNFWLHHFAGASLLAKAIYLSLLLLSVAAWAIIIAKVRALRRNARGTRQFLELYRGCAATCRASCARSAAARGRRSRRWPPSSCAAARSCRPGSAAKPRRRRPRGRASRRCSFRRSRGRSRPSRTSTFSTWSISWSSSRPRSAPPPSSGCSGRSGGSSGPSSRWAPAARPASPPSGPGISEALIATAAGLIVAIPALLGYNFIGARIRELAGEADAFTADFLALIERDFVREERP